MPDPLRLDRALIRISGTDTFPFLNNLLTQNIDRLRTEPVVYSGLLTPQGKVLADMFVWADSDDAGDSVLIECAHGASADLVRRLIMYRLRANVRVDDITGTLDVLFSLAAFDGASPDPRLPALGWRAVSPDPPEPARFADGEALYARHRIGLGAPDLARDAAPEEVFAGEALFEELNGVDFQKGCFVGQENVSRMKRRATTRKKFCRIGFDGPAPAPSTPIRAGEAELGSVRSGVEGAAIALLRLDRALEAAEKGENLLAEGQEMRLDPPEWLILPQRGEG